MFERKSVSTHVGNADVSFEVGRVAGQADAAVLARAGDTVVLATVVMSRKAREGIEFFPLLVDYEERLYAAGKIKGSRWIKREGRASDNAILRGRVIDRSLRPLFPDGMRNDVQVVATVMSYDGVNDPDILAVNAASMALHLSHVPFDGPISSVRVGMAEGQLVVNPSPEQVETGDMDLVVCGTGDHIIMVEAGLKFVPETKIVEGVRFAQQYLGALCKLQDEFRKQVGKEKTSDVIYSKPAEQIVDFVHGFATDDKIDAALYVPTKEQRDAGEFKLEKETVAAAKEKFGSTLGEAVNVEKQTADALNKIMKQYTRKQILEKERRVDGRKLDQTRQITCEVGVLPRTHGSALFTRGETQALTTVTLGSKGDEQMLDGIDDPSEGTPKRYMHHYNMPGYSVGEVTPIRGPGRREIGHGALAERAVEFSLPAQTEFPYTMRLVSEVLSSNGSTSMASTCGSTLALMDAGVPIQKIVGGVAMGLVMDEQNPSRFKVLTDIAGIEDFNGHMDFKVTGTEEGVTALQLDIKVKGLTPEILEAALEQAKPGRAYILSKMKECLDKPRPDLSPYAPRIYTLHIKPEKIREVIGSGGKVVNDIIAKTGVKIDIENDGTIMVVSVDKQAADRAIEMINAIARDPEPGEVFEGKVTRLMNFGAFVEIAPGKEGMVHVSELANYRVGQPSDVVSVGDPLKVQVLEIDDQGRLNLTHRPFAGPAPEGAEPRGPAGGDRGPRDFRSGPPRGGHGGGHGGGFRGGHGGPRHGGGDRGPRRDFGDRAPRPPRPEGPATPGAPAAPGQKYDFEEFEL